MKSFKRTITMLLAIAMVLTNVSFVAFAGVSFSDITDANVDAAVGKLVAYGIITGYDDNGDGVAEVFKPNNQITRAEFATIVTRMKGVADSLPQDSITGFADLDKDDTRAWARPYVKSAVELGIIDGFPDGTFRAADPVTYEQAVKMLVCAIGYGDAARKTQLRLEEINPTVSWSKGYIDTANKQNMLKNAFTVNVEQPALRGTVAILTSNAMEVPPLVLDEDGNFTQDSSGTTQNEVNKVTISGYIVETYLTGLRTDSTNLEKDEIRIDATDNKRDGRYTLSRNLRESIDLEDYIGRKIVAYYDTVDHEITSIDLKYTDSVIISEEEITSVTADQLRAKVDGEVISESLINTTFIVNGKYTPYYDIANDFKNGTIEFFYSVDSRVAIVNSYDVFVVNSLDKTNKKIYLKYDLYNGNNYFLFPGTDSSKIQIYVKSENGSSYNLTSYDSLRLSEYDVINYRESHMSTNGNVIRKMYVTKGRKTGEVTRIFSDQRKIEIDKNTLYLTNQYNNFAGNASDKKVTFDTSTSYTYYLDYTGQIAAVDYDQTRSDSTWAYGYLMEADENTNEVRIMQASGTHKVYRLRENVEVDGVLMDTERAFAKLEEASREILANKNSLTCTNPNLYAQPLQYSIRGTEIEGFDTHKQIAQIPTPGDEFTYDGAFDGTAGSTSTTKVTASGVSYNVNTSTLVFFVPKDRNDEKAYAKISSPSVAFAVTKNRMVETFAIDTTKSGSPARMVIVYGLNPTLNFIGSSPYMVVSEIHGGAFDREYEGYVNGAKDIKTVAVSSNNFVTTIDGETNLVAADFVKKGDLIRYIIDNQGEIVAVKMLYDRSKGDTTKFEDGTNFVEADEGSGNNFYAALGVIEAKEDADKRIRVLADSERSFKYSDSTRIYKFDADGVLGEISIEEVHDGSLGQEKSRVIVISKSKVNDAAATVIYVIK